MERKLHVLTSVGPNSDCEDMENGVMTLQLVVILPTNLLDLCASVLARPSLERVMQWAAIGISIVLFLCIVMVSFIEADRILRSALASYSKESTVQPPLDLRLLSHISGNNNTTQISSGGNCSGGSGGSVGSATSKTITDKIITSDDKSKTRKDETFPDWTLMNVKKSKDKDSQRGLKIPDWSAEEERKFKLDTESKDLLSFKRCDEPSNADNANAAATANNTCGTKRKSNKKQTSIQEAMNADAVNDTSVDTQASQEKKCAVNTTTKSSPTSSRKGKAQVTQSSIKEEPKVVDHEVDLAINSRTTKVDNKRSKQTNNSENDNNQNNLLVLSKTFELASIRKIVHLSEEEISSTTAESPTHDEAILCKVSASCANKLYSGEES